MGKKISFILLSIIFLGIFSVSFADTISIDTISIGEIEDEFEIDFPINGVCKSIYNNKNVFEIPSDLCESGIFYQNDGKYFCLGSDGGNDIQCDITQIFPPLASEHETTHNAITWKWKNDDKNGEREPKNIQWFQDIPSGDIEPTKDLFYTYIQKDLRSNTNYTSYIIAFDDLGNHSKPIALNSKTKAVSSSGGGGPSWTPPKEPEVQKSQDPEPKEEIQDPKGPSTPQEPKNITKNPPEPQTIEEENKVIPVYPIIKHPKRTCEPNELVMETRCIYPNIDFTLNDIQDNFAYKYIYSLASAGIVQGYYDTGLFQPDNSISRSEYLKILFKAFCIEYSETSTQNIPFTDVESENWEAKIIAKALELDIISTENTLFRPHQAISRAESMKLLFKVAGVIPQDVHVGLFEDVPNETWEVKYIQKAYESCIIDGKEIQGNLYFEPYQNTTRAEVSKIIANALMLER